MQARFFCRSLLLSSATALLFASGCAEGDGQTPSPEPAVTPEPGDGPETEEPEGPGPAPVTGQPPTLHVAEAQQVGARGQSVRITFEASDPDDDVSGVALSLLTAAGAEIPLVDRDADGVLDDPQRRIFFDVTIPPADPGSTNFTAEAWLPAIFDEAPEAASIRMRVIDGEGSSSSSLDIEIAQQSEVGEGESCDATYILTRCPYGMGCSGEPAVCAEGTAPQIERLAYLEAGDASEILVDGIEAEDDLKALFIEFQDRNGAPVLLDLDADGTPESENFNVDVFGRAIDGRFLFRLDQAPSFSEAVEQIVVTPVDDHDHIGEPVSARLGRPPVRGFNQACDTFGFDVCTTGAACTPDDNGSGSRCRVLGPMQSERCENAPVVEPGEAVVIAGDAFGASLWDPPNECAANSPTNRPEGAVILHLAEPVAGLRVRTDYEGTNFDTIVYITEGCPREITAAIGCDDDGGLGVFSDLDVGFVPAGDYLIVVDSYDIDGGNFVLTVETE